MKKVFKVLLVGMLVWCGLALAADSAPVSILRDTSNEMIAALKKNQANLDNNQALVDKLVRKILLPHVDLDAMSRAALGRDAWGGASAAQRKAFQEQFTVLIIRTYGSALSEYTDETVDFMPLRGGLTPDQSRVQVYSRINRTGAPSIAVNYRLVKRGSDWLVYDFSVEGISMIQSFRSQFSSSLSGGSSLDDLIKRLKQHNAKTSKAAS